MPLANKPLANTLAIRRGEPCLPHLCVHTGICEGGQRPTGVQNPTDLHPDALEYT